MAGLRGLRCAETYPCFDMDNVWIFQNKQVKIRPILLSVV